MKKFLKAVLKFAAIFSLILVFGFSNLAPGLLQQIGLNQLAKELEVKKVLAASAGDGRVLYGASTNTTPFERTYVGGTLNAQNPLPAATANITQVQADGSVTADESLLIAQSSAANIPIYAYHRTGATWTQDWTVNTTNASANYRGFDVEYEELSGKGIAVYTTNVANPSYRIWRPSLGTWTAAQTITVARTTGAVRWMQLAVRKGTNEMAVIYEDANSDLNVLVSTGCTDTACTWAQEPSTLLEGSVGYEVAAADAKAFDADYLADGRLLIAWGKSATPFALSTIKTAGSGTYTTCYFNTTSCATATAVYAAAIGASSLRAEPAGGNNRAVFAGHDTAGNDLEVAAFDGTKWSVVTSDIDASTGATGAAKMIVETAFMVSGSVRQGIVFYADSTGTGLDWYNWNASGGATSFVAGTDIVVSPALGVGTETSHFAKIRPDATNELMMTTVDSTTAMYLTRLVWTGAAACTSSCWTVTNIPGSSLGAPPAGISTPLKFIYDRYFPAIVTAATTGTQTVNLDAGTTAQYVGGALTFSISSGSDTVTSMTVSQNGTENTANLPNVNLYYDNGGGYGGGDDTLFGTGSLGSAISGSMTVTAGTTRSVYIVLDVGSSAVGGNTIEPQITASADFTLSGGSTKAGTYPVQLSGSTTIRPVITSYTNSTESGLNYSGGCSTCGARIGPISTSKQQTIVITGAGFGADPGSGSRDTASNKVEIIGASTNLIDDDGSANSNVTAWSATSITIRTNSELTGDTDTDWGTNFGGAAALKITAGSQAVGTNLNFYIFPQITSLTTPLISNAARESESITLNGTRFGSSQGTGTSTILGVDVGAASSWTNTAISVTVPTAIADSSYTGNVEVKQGTGANSKTHTFPSTFRILPRILSTGPVDAKGGQSQAVTVTGNHFCQDAACADYATDSDDATFNGVSAKASYTAVSDTSISLSVPATATDGNLIVKSDSANGGTVYDSNSYSYNVKFGASTPTGNSAGGNNNPTLSGNAFSDGTDGDTHLKTQWQVAHNTDGDWATPEWIRTSGSAEIGTTVNTTNGTFQNSDAGQTELDCGTTYKGRVRYMDNGNAGADTQTWEWSSWSSNYTFSTGSCNAAPTISISQPPAGNVNVTQGDSYNITYTLSDTDDVVVGNFYYDTNSSGLDGTAITGCQSQAEGTNAICAWNTTGYPVGTYYVYATTTDGINPQQSAYSAGTITIQAPPEVTPTATGTQTTPMNSGTTTQYIGAAFRFQQTSGSADTITALTISETGTVNASTTLSNATIRYETGNAGTCAYDGAETIAKSGVAFNSSDKAIFTSLTSNIPLTLSANYTCVYLIFDLANGANYPSGGQTIDFEITSSADFTLQNGTTKTGTYPVQLSGSTNVRPQITGYTNSTESGLNYAASCTGCGARIGPVASSKSQTIVISGYGFGSDPGSGSRDTATNKVEVGTKVMTDNPASSNVTAWSNTSITVTTDTAVDDDTSWGTNFGGANALKVTAGSQASAANLNFYVFPQITSLSTNTGTANGAREYNSADNHGVITLNGTRFGSSQGTGYVRILGCDATTCSSPTGSATTTSWTNTAVSAEVPPVISNSSYTGSVVVSQGTGANSKTHTFSTLRVLPRILSLDPTSGISGTDTTINGDHFCQTGTCPATAALWNTPDDGDDVKWGTINATVLSTPSIPTHTVAYADAPSITPNTYSVTLTSNNYSSNGIDFTIQSSEPNAPTGLYQLKTNNDNSVLPPDHVPWTNENPDGKLSAGSGFNQTNVWVRASSTAPVTATLCIQAQWRLSSGTFDDEVTNIVNGADLGTDYDGCDSVTVGNGEELFVQITGLTDGNSYKWRTRIKNNGAGTYGPWINADVDGNGRSFYVDTAAPTSLGSCGMHSSVTAGGATIQWTVNTTGEINTNFTKQVQYSTSSAFTTELCAPGSTCGTPTSGINANPQTVNLTSLTPNTAYYYRVRSKDVAGNEKIVGYGLSGDTACTFTTSKAETRTTEFFAMARTAVISAGATATSSFVVYIPESGYTIQSAFVELSGVFGGNDADGSAGLRLYVNSQGQVNYTVNTATGAVTTPFSIIHSVPVAYLNVATPTEPNNSNTLYVSIPSAGDPSASVISAKILVTYYHTPVQ